MNTQAQVNRARRKGWRRWHELTPDEKQIVLCRYQLHVPGPEAYAYWVEDLPSGYTTVFTRRPVGRVRNWAAISPFED